MKKIKLLTIYIISLLIILNTNTKYIHADTCIYRAKVLYNTFIFNKPSWQSDRIGEAHLGEIYNIITSVSDDTNSNWFVAINYNDRIAYIPYCAVEEISLYSEKIVDSNSIDRYGFIELRGNIREESYKDLINTYMLIPLNIREVYQIEGFKIKMTEQYIADEAFKDYGGWNGGHLNGAFDYEKKILFLNDENARHVVHEVGHFVNDRLNMMSERKQYKELYESEACKISIYAMSNSREYFAECFDLYCRNPEYLEDISIESYNMIEQAINEINVIHERIFGVQ